MIIIVMKHKQNYNDKILKTVYIHAKWKSLVHKWRHIMQSLKHERLLADISEFDSPAIWQKFETIGDCIRELFALHITLRLSVVVDRDGKIDIARRIADPGIIVGKSVFASGNRFFWGSTFLILRLNFSNFWKIFSNFPGYFPYFLEIYCNFPDELS